MDTARAAAAIRTNRTALRHARAAVAVGTTVLLRAALPLVAVGFPAATVVHAVVAFRAEAAAAAVHPHQAAAALLPAAAVLQKAARAVLQMVLQTAAAADGEEMNSFGLAGNMF